jgi:hypothetical protein
MNNKYIDVSVSRSSTLLVKGSYLISTNEMVCTIYVLYKHTLHASIHLLA